MPQSSDILSVATLTAAVNERKAPNNFLYNLLFRGREKPVATKDIEISYKRRGRQMAPFVKRNGAALYTKGGSESFATVRPAHIRTKRPMTPSELFDKRRPGMSIFPDDAALVAAQRQFIAEQQEDLMDEIDNTEEWMAAMALRGEISYSAEDEESFVITFPRLASHEIDLGGGEYWSNSAPAIEKHFLQAATLVSDDIGAAVTDVILGKDAADEFLEKAKASTLLDIRRLATGQVDFNQQLMDSGALYLGTFVHGIRVWRYHRQQEMPDGTTVDLIRPNYAEFIASPQNMEAVAYYGAIEDFDAMGGSAGLLKSKRFSKSWLEKDPSARMMLVESNPLPMFRRPDGTVSMQVLV